MPWSTGSFAELLDNENTLAFIVCSAALPQRIQALILARVAADEAEILTLGTTPQLRRSGLARGLVVAASVQAYAIGARDIFLEVAVNNDAARALYSELGFLLAGKRPSYYCSNTENVDALVLRAALPLHH